MSMSVGFGFDLSLTGPGARGCQGDCSELATVGEGLLTGVEDETGDEPLAKSTGQVMQAGEVLRPKRYESKKAVRRRGVLSV
jgi:hypothetical protein